MQALNICMAIDYNVLKVYNYILKVYNFLFWYHFKSWDHSVLRVSFWDWPFSGNVLACRYSRGHSVCVTFIKLSQNNCDNDLLDELKTGSCGMKK